MRLTVRLVLLMLVVSPIVVLVPRGHAGTPTTLAQSRLVGAAPVEPGFPVDFVGVLWDGAPSDGGSVRFRHDGVWTGWSALQPDGAEANGAFASALVAGDDADAYQVRVPGGAGRARAVAINTTDGQRRKAENSTAVAATSVISRAGWGADESLRFDAAGQEKWPPAYYPAQKLTAHHTATTNADPDPAATVRAIYRYHAVDRGWGDIGYQYLVDESGRVYEGRWSGSDGDPAHDATGKVVTAAHVAGYNSGNVGVALLGTLTSQAPTPAAQHSLEQLLADLATRHTIDPQGSGSYVNPVNGATLTVANISGHRDWEATECPGGTFYAGLPAIRSNVAALMGASSTTTTSATSTTTSTSSTSTSTSSTTSTTRGPKRRK